MAGKILASLSALLSLDTKGFDKGVKSVKSHSTALQSSMKAIGGAIAGAFSVGAVVNFAKESISAATDQIRAEEKLVTALKGRKDIADALIRQANDLQGKTMFSDEDIINSQAMLATFTRNSAQLKELTPLVLDYAQAFGLDVASAAKQVGKALSDTSGKIGRTGIEAEGAAGSYERFSSVVSILSDKFKDQAQNAIPEELKQLREVQVSVDEFKESWGKMLLAIGQQLPVEKFTEGMDYMTWRLEKFTELGGGFSNWFKRFLHVGEFSEEAFNAASNLNAFEDAMSETTEVSSSFNETITQSTEELEEEAKAASKAAEEYKKLLQEKRNLDEASMKKITGGISPITTDELTGSGAMTDQQSKILDAMSTVGGSRITGMQLPVEQVEEMEMALRELPGTYATVTEEMEATSQRLKSAFESIGSALGNAIGEFIKGEAKFSDVATSLIQEIIKVVAGYLTESVAASFAGGASAGGPAAAFTGAAAAAAALSMFGAIVPALMAKGGTVPGGYPNDTYPALLSSGETVLPAPHKLDAMAGAQRVVVEGRIRGQDIYFVNEKQTSKLSRYRSVSYTHLRRRRC